MVVIDVAVAIIIDLVVRGLFGIAINTHGQIWGDCEIAVRNDVKRTTSLHIEFTPDPIRLQRPDIPRMFALRALYLTGFLWHRNCRLQIAFFLCDPWGKKYLLDSGDGTQLGDSRSRRCACETIDDPM